MARRYSASSSRALRPNEIADLRARGWTGGGGDDDRGGSDRSYSRTEDREERESTDNEVDRAKRLGEVAAQMAEESKSKDFDRQRTIDGERFGRDRQAAAEDFSYSRQAASQDNAMALGRMSQASRLSQDEARNSSSLRREESSQEDRQQRGRMELGSSLELKQRNNALSTALSVLNRFR